MKKFLVFVLFLIGCASDSPELGNPTYEPYEEPMYERGYSYRLNDKAHGPFNCKIYDITPLGGNRWAYLSRCNKGEASAVVMSVQNGLDRPLMWIWDR